MLPVISGLGCSHLGCFVLLAVLTVDLIAASYFVPEPPMQAIAKSPTTNKDAIPTFARIQRLC